MIKNILVVCEGKKTEPKFINNLIREYLPSDNIEVYSFCTTIYRLYDLYTKYDCSFDELDLLEVLKEERKNNLTDNEKKILDNIYTDIFLIFDYDPQTPNFKILALEKMLEHFSDSTEYGKLYINYPMFEAYRHISKQSVLNNQLDECFFKLTFTKDQLIVNSKKNNYKTILNNDAFLSAYNQPKEVLDLIISNHLSKFIKLLNIKQNFLHDKYISFLNMQNRLFIKNDFAYVLNTAIFFIPEI